MVTTARYQRVTTQNKSKEKPMPYTSQEERIRVAHNKKKIWALPVEAVDPTGANDRFAYLLNNNGSLKYELFALEAYSTVSGVIEIARCTGTASGGTGQTPANMVTDAGQAPDVTYETGADITGLTADGVRLSVGLLANAGRSIKLVAGIQLGFNEALEFNWVPATGILDCTFYIMEVPDPVE